VTRAPSDDTLSWVAEETLSDVFQSRRRPPAPGPARTVLRVVLLAGRPLDAPSRHVIDEVDLVELGRGPRSVERGTHGGLSRLVIRIPDPMMSSDHGRLVCSRGRWMLDDPKSKNGAVVAGRPTRSAPVEPGDVFELGHTLFTLDDEPIPADAVLDLHGSDLSAPSPGLATFHPQLAKDVERLATVAPSNVAVLLHGETGTGKEVFARALHELSGRRGAFVAVHCGGLVDTLLEAELFGHTKGAFTGAHAGEVGYLRAADRGTLFLDEIGDLPPGAQIALLRALQERAVTPVGGTAPVAVDFRLCAATHRDLEAMTATDAFRSDLFARLLGVAITLPPLRERRGDLGLLIARLLETMPSGAGARFSPAAAYALARHDWPLNVRELERALAAALALAGRGTIDVEHLPAPIAARLLESAGPCDGDSRAASSGDDELRGALIAALDRHHGNVAAAARDLGKHREQIHRWARRFGIDLESFRR